MVKILLQIATTLFVDDTDVEFVSWCRSIYSILAYKFIAQMIKKIYIIVGFVAELHK